MCWYRIGSPPPAGSKKAVPKFRSVKSIVIAPARTGKDNNISQDVTKIDHENSGTLKSVMPGALMFKKVVIMLISHKIDYSPDR